MSQPAPQEIEAKFLIGDPAQIAPLRTAAELSPAYPLEDIGVVEMVDEYLDTPDLRLLRQGYGLRIRSLVDRRLVTLKSRRVVPAGAQPGGQPSASAGSDDSADPSLDTGSVYRRMEMEMPLAAGATIAPISGWPEGMMQTLLPLLNGAQRLVPLCRLEQTRQKRAIFGAGEALAELSFDDVRVRADRGGPTLAHYGEMEIELTPGRDETELHAIVAALQTQLAMEPSPVSKLEHALDVIGRHPAAAPENWQGMRVDMHMAEACRLIWREQLTQMVLNEAGVRFARNPEYVHDMRVATRRARAAAKLYGDYFKPKAIRRYLRGLRRTARLLGAVRDLDVAIGKLERFGGRKKGYDAAQLAATLEGWRQRRAAAHADLLAWLDSSDYARFIGSFAKFCRSPGEGAHNYTARPGEAPVPHQVRHVMPSMILNRYESIRSYETLFEGEEGPGVEVLHLLRIECKYLRYNLEFVSNLLGPEARRLLADLRKLQEDLGDLHDAVVSKQMLEEEQGAGRGDSSRVGDRVGGHAGGSVGGSVGGSAGSVAAGVGGYQRAQDRVIRRLSEQLEGDLHAFLSYRNRRRLVLAVAWI